MYAIRVSRMLLASLLTLISAQRAGMRLVLRSFPKLSDATLGEVSASGGSTILDSKLMPLPFLLRLRFLCALPNIDTNLCNIKL